MVPLAVPVQDGLAQPGPGGNDGGVPPAAGPAPGVQDAQLVGRQLEDAVAECERGLEINPNNSDLLGNLGAYLAGLGKSQEAIDACSLALRLNPRSPGNFWRHINIAIAHFTAANYAAALQESKNVARSRAH